MKCDSIVSYGRLILVVTGFFIPAEASLSKQQLIQDSTNRLITPVHFALYHKDLSLARECMKEGYSAAKRIPFVDLNGGDICAILNYTPGLNYMRSLSIEPNSDRYKSFTQDHLAVLFSDLQFKRSMLYAIPRLKNGETVLHLAAVSGHLPTIKKMLALRPELLTLKNNLGFLPVEYAAMYGTKESLNFLLDYYDAQEEDQQALVGWNLWHCAAYNSDPEVLKSIFGFPTKRMIADKGESVVHIAAFGGTDKHLIFLKEQGMSLHSKAKKERTVVHFAARNNKSSSCLEYLLDNEGMSPAQKDSAGLTAAHHAAALGTVKNLEIILSKHPELLYMRSNDGATPVHLASGNQDVTVLEYLIDEGCDIEVEDNDGMRPIHYAAQKGTPEHLRLLCKNDVSLRTVTKEQDTVLHCAAQNSLTSECTVFFLEKGCDPYAQNSLGATPHGYAALVGRKETLELLLEKAPIEDTPLENGFHLTHFAVCNNDPNVLALCTQKGFRLNVTTNKGMTPLLVAVARSTGEMVKQIERCGISLRNKKDFLVHRAAGNSDSSVLDYLLSCRLSPRGKNKFGREPIHEAARSGTRKNMELLVKHGASLDALTTHGNTLMHEAALNRNETKCLDYILETRGNQVTARNNQGEVPLVFAVLLGTVGSIKKIAAQYNLLEGMSGKSKSHSYQLAYKFFSQNNATLAHAASFNPDESVLAYLIQPGIILAPGYDCYDDFDSVVHWNTDEDKLPIHYAALNGTPQHIQILLAAHSKSQSAVTLQKETLLHFAAQNPKSETLEFLLTRGFNVDAQDESGCTPLHYAARSGFIKHVELLLSYGASLNCVDSQGVSILHEAAKSNCGSLITLLLNKKMHVAYCDKNGTTALHYAMEKGAIQSIEVLLKARASLEASNAYGESPIDMSQKHENEIKTQICTLIKRYYSEQNDYYSWWQHAQADFDDTLKLGLSDNSLYHAQQAAEKFLKSLLVIHVIEPPSSHNLSECLNLLKKVLSVPQELADQAKMLTPYANKSRYPNKGPQKKLTLNAATAKNYAKAIRDFAAEQINKRCNAVIL